MARKQSVRLLRELVLNNRGALLVETAIVTPILLLLALGSYDAGRLVTRQIELQSGIADAEAIVLAANAGAATNTVELTSILKNSLNLAASNVSVSRLFRCNEDPDLVTSSDTCSAGAVVSSYIQIRLHDTYAPMWTNFGISKTFAYNVERTIQLDTVET